MKYSSWFTGLDGVDTILISNGGENAIDKAFFYATGADEGLFEGSSVIITPESERATMFVYSLEEQSARKTSHEVIAANSQARMRENISKALKGKMRVGINFSSLTLEMYNELRLNLPDVQFVDVSKNILNSRMIKSDEEIKPLREAARISSEALPSILEHLKEGITEKELAADIVYEMMKAGADGPSFESIVCFGSNASIPHHSPESRKLKRGDFVLMDYGAVYRRYCSDNTRTVVFGKAEEKQKEIYSIVYEAQKKAMEMVRDGVNGREVNAKALEVIDSTEYKGRLMHGIGHGIGLEVHDHHALGSSDFILRKGMAITDEPGIYIPGYGGVRIEDDLIVKEDGFSLITNQPSKDLIEVS
jgi:Xaa-Pro dipeptidase